MDCRMVTRMGREKAAQAGRMTTHCNYPDPNLVSDLHLY
jgi:hypothetical protein